MGRNSRTARRTPSQARADRQSDELAARLGVMLKEARQQRGMKQGRAAELAGLSASAWSWLEVGRDGRVTLATINRAAVAVGADLKAYLTHLSAATQPRDLAHLRGQELVIQTAAPGQWQPRPEEFIDREARTSRAIDVLLTRRAAGQPTCYALVEIWNWLEDVGAAVRDWTRRIDAVERYAIGRMVGDEPLPRVGGIWVLRATNRNRQLVHAHRGFFKSRFPGSARAWLAALTRPGADMPNESALMWINVKGERLLPSRLG